jgi:hypothetical protein
MAARHTPPSHRVRAACRLRRIVPVGLLAAAAAAVSAVAAAPAQAYWPLVPIRRVHPVRAGFLDYRDDVSTGDVMVWHKGIDIPFDATRCNPHAPPGGCLKVFAIRSGPVWAVHPERMRRCGDVRIGNYGYGHVLSPQVRVGQRVKAGQFIAWTCASAWHIHISDFAAYPCGPVAGNRSEHAPACTYLDPQRRGAPLSDPADHTPPRLLGWTFDPSTGYLDARIEDVRSPGWMTGPWSRMYNNLPPAQVAVNGVTLVKALWEPGVYEPPPPSLIYTPGTPRNVTASQCGNTPALTSCAGPYWFRLGRFQPGQVVTVDAWDSRGNELQAQLTMR